MLTHISKRQLWLSIMLAIMLVLLSACADGEAHVTVNMNGTTDLDLNLSVSDAALGKIGQDNLMPLLAQALERNNFKTEVTKQDDQNLLKASAHYEKRNTTAFDSSKLPPGIRIEQSKTPGFFTSKMHILVEADLMESMPDGDIKERINQVPGFLKRLLLKDMNFDFKLSLPIKAKDSNADQLQDGGKTLVWDIAPLEKNTLDLTIQIPNIRNILIVAIAGLVLIVALLIWFFIRRRRVRQQYKLDRNS